MTENYSAQSGGAPPPIPGMTAPPPAYRPTCGLATGSFICGLFGLVTGLLAGLPAIFMGHSALGKIGRSRGALGGKGLAVTGVILGYFSILVTVVIVVIALAALATPQIYKANKRAALAEAVSNARHVKLALDTFATDFDGQFPNDDTGEGVVSGGTGTTYSNDYFRQLFLAGATESESIFWVAGSPIAASTPPDEKFKSAEGRMVADWILERGDVHWAYISDQTNFSTGSRPLILDGYPKNESEFDPDIWDNKAIVVTVDGAAKPMRIRPTDGRVLDWKGKSILSSQADAWDGESPAELLKQPEPVR